MVRRELKHVHTKLSCRISPPASVRVRLTVTVMKPHQSNQADAFSDEEVRLIWKEVKLIRGWTRAQFFQKFQEANPEFVTANWNHKHLEKLLVSKPKNKKREPVPSQWYPCIANTFGWSSSQFEQYLKTGNRPVTLFRDMDPKSWQEIPRVECPHPYPNLPDGNNSAPPFQRNLASDIFFVAGWKVRLQADVRYRVTCDFVRNKVWPEVEIVLYVRVPHTEMWQRAASFGSVTSLNCASDVTPQVEEWLITCWGKRVIADDAPWFYFVPVPEFDLDATVGRLKLRFSAPNRQGKEGGAPVSMSAAESSPVVHMQAVEAPHEGRGKPEAANS